MKAAEPLRVFSTLDILLGFSDLSRGQHPIFSNKCVYLWDSSANYLERFRRDSDLLFEGLSPL